MAYVLTWVLICSWMPFLTTAVYMYYCPSIWEERVHAGNTTYTAGSHPNSIKPRQCNNMNVNGYKNTEYIQKQTIIYSGKYGSTALERSVTNLKATRIPSWCWHLTRAWNKTMSCSLLYKVIALQPSNNFIRINGKPVVSLIIFKFFWANNPRHFQTVGTYLIHGK